MKHVRTAILSLLALVVGGRCLAAEAQPGRYEFRWVYVPCNMLTDKDADRVIGLIERAARAGYNGMVIADFKFNKLKQMADHLPRYFKNVARVRQAAAKASIELIPTVFPIGYSDGLLQQDPNLAEGLPVERAPFVVKDGRAIPQPETAMLLKNGDLEETKGDKFVGYYQDQPGTMTFADHDVVHGGKSACRMQAADGGRGTCRLIQSVRVRPHTCYCLSCWVKTKDLKSADFRLMAIGSNRNGRSLTFHEARLPATRDWTRLEVAFNSLDENAVSVFIGVWSKFTGSLWIDDLALEELSLVNVLRRAGCPLVVTSEDGKTIYVEGKDFQPVRDEKMGGDGSGQYDFHHAGATIRLTEKSAIQEGDRLRVSWYHPIVTHGTQVACCLTDPKIDRMLGDQARRVDDLLHPTSFFMQHDELRVANWCRACQERKRTPGELLADEVGRCAKIIGDQNPKARILVWSDMFDPYHNMRDNYYLVNGSLKGSWQGLPRNVIIVNWNGGKAADSLKWFAERGYPQIIAGYYDSDLDNFNRWNAAAKGVPNVRGFMYTTWRGDYSKPEAFGKALSEAK